MKKIRGFKLNLRVKEIQRRAKKAGLNLESVGPLEPLLERAAAAAKPAVLFESFAHPDPAEAALLSPMPGLAYSLVLATLGDSLFDVPAPLLPIIEEVAPEEVVRFATALLEEEAAAEACVLGPINPLSDNAAIELLLAKLDGSKIGITFAENHLIPSASRALSLSWLAKTKSKGKAK